MLASVIKYPGVHLNTVKPVLSGHSERRPNIGFQDRLSLNASQKYFRPSLSYHLQLRPLFCLFLSGRLKQVLLYMQQR